MTRKVLNRIFWSIMVCAVAGVLLAIGMHAIAADSETKAPDAKAEKKVYTSVDGTCNFMRRDSTWKAKLTPNEDGSYKASYVAVWQNNPNMAYEGTIKSDWKGEISGNGVSTGGGRDGGNGSFEFSGKFDEKGVAQCTYKEVGGRGSMGRTGTLTVNQPKP
jgi:hypothetical protein